MGTHDVPHVQAAHSYPQASSPTLVHDHGTICGSPTVSDTVGAWYPIRSPILVLTRIFCKTEPNCPDPNPPTVSDWCPKNQIRYRGGLGSRTVWQIQGSIRYDPICRCIKYPGSETISDQEGWGMPYHQANPNLKSRALGWACCWQSLLLQSLVQQIL